MPTSPNSAPRRRSEPEDGCNSLNGAAIGSGETVTVAPSASASIGGAFINNGTVNGPTAAGQSLMFTDDVSGAGSFTGNVTFSDGFSPGMSTAAVSLGNFTFDGTTTLHIEIGGLAAGTQFDRLNFTGSGVLGGELERITRQRLHSAGRECVHVHPGRHSVRSIRGNDSAAARSGIGVGICAKRERGDANGVATGRSICASSPW